MKNAFLFVATLLCWAPTWYIIKFQFGYVDPIISVFYRLGLACIIFFSILLITKKQLKYSLNYHLWFATLGGCLFSFNYIFFYLANTYLISGLVCVAFSANLLFNIIGEKIFFNRNSSIATWFAAFLGGLGIFIIFNHEIINFNLNDDTHVGIALSFIATLFWSCGNMVHTRNSKNKFPFFQSVAFGLMYGSIFTLLAAKIQGAEILIELSIKYILALFYLSIFGTVLAFYLYLSLVDNIGSDRAGYVGVMMPVLALLISSYFENLQWSNNLLIGLPILLIGSVLILNQKNKIII